VTRWITAACLRSRGIVLAAAVAMLVVGVLQVRDLPRDSLPEFRPPTVEIQTEALGLSATEVEQMITVPLEQDLLAGVAFLDAIHSESTAGVSRVELAFEPGTDLRRARQVVNERLTQAHGLPNVSQPPQMLQPLSSTSRVMMVGLSSEDLSLIDLSVLARWTIRPRLLGIPGVANVSIWGLRDKQLQVRVDPARLRAAGVPMQDVISSTGNALWTSPLTFLEASTPGVGGFFDTSTQRIGVRHELPISSAKDLAKIPLDVATGDGPPVRLGDVTDVVEDHSLLIGDAILADADGLYLVVEKLPEANAVEVSHGLEDALDTMHPGLGDVEVDTSVFEPAAYVEQSDANLRTPLLVGAVLLVLALLFLFWSWRRALVAAVAIALSLAGGVIVLAVRDTSLNTMTIAGLVLAIVVIVDDAIVGAAHRDAPDPVTRVVRVRGPLGYATAIALLVLVPIALLHGEAGAFLEPLALSYIGALLVSAVVALTVTPTLVSTLRLGDARTVASPFERAAVPRFRRAASRFVGSPTPVATALGLMLVVGVAAVPFMERGTSLVPELQDRNVLVQWRAAPGTSLGETTRVTRLAERELARIDGIDSVGAHAGRAILGDQIVGTNAAEMWLTIADDADYGATLAAVEGVTTGYPGLEARVVTYPRERIDEILVEPEGVSGRDLTVRVFGPDATTLRKEADKVAGIARRVDGVEGAAVDAPVMEPTLDVEVDLAKAEALGIKPGDVRRAAATLVSGVTVGSLFEQEKIFDVVVWSNPELRSDLTAIRRMELETPGGETVALGDVANVRIVPGPAVIEHADVSQYMDVAMDVRGRDRSAVADDLEARMRRSGFALHHHAEVLRTFESDASSSLAFVLALMVTAIGVFLLLQAALRSWKLASAVFVSLLAAASGGALAVLIDGRSATIGTIAGFLGLVAIGARFMVLLARTTQAAEDDRPEEFGPELVVDAAASCVTAIACSAVAVLVVYLPLLLTGADAGLEVVHPMAVVLVGGILTTTFTTLFVVPSLQLRFGRRPAEGREDLERDLGTPAPA